MHRIWRPDDAAMQTLQLASATSAFAALARCRSHGAQNLIQQCLIATLSWMVANRSYFQPDQLWKHSIRGSM
jgi:hypothetical protein